VRSQRAYLLHVLRCIDRIKEDSAAGHAAVLQSLTLQDAILRNLQLLCESTQRLSPELKRAHPEIDWRAITGMRNVLVHDYFEVDFGTVWRIVERDLPALERAVTRALDELGEPDLFAGRGPSSKPDDQ
jgi:uncharacterized protein with HEPN domain